MMTDNLGPDSLRAALQELYQNIEQPKWFNDEFD